MKQSKKIKKHRNMWISLSIVAVLIISVIAFMNKTDFGRIPSGDRLVRIKESPNFHDGQFKNIHETQQITSDKSFFSMILDFLFKKKERLQPETGLPSVQTNLWQLSRNEDALVWFGHSSYLLQVDSIRFLIDPVLSGAASPISYFNKPFKGTDTYKPADIPEIDYLVISHDHWDHLDYKTVMQLKDRIKKVVCGLGVGEHFERWGFNKADIIELDWNEDIVFENGFTIRCLSARHFSGRGISPNRSLWASYLIETPSQKIYISGDGGYDTHYTAISERFGEIGLAILENGQYDKDWKYIHMLPDQIVQAFKDLNAKKLFTVHHSKFALGNHPWDEPLKNISVAAERDSIPLIQPMIGELVNLNDSVYHLNKWWEGID